MEKEKMNNRDRFDTVDELEEAHRKFCELHRGGRDVGWCGYHDCDECVFSWMRSEDHTDSVQDIRTVDELGISPYPWLVGESHSTELPVVKDIVYDLNKNDVVEWCNGDDDAEKEANARLIAAAPELYEALAAMLSCAEKNRPYLDMSHMDIAMDMSRKALRKAVD